MRYRIFWSLYADLVNQVSSLLNFRFLFFHQAELEEEDIHQDEDLQNAVPDYRLLIAIHAGKLKGGLDSWLSIDPYKVRRLSLSEQELENAVRTHGTEIVRY